MISKVTQSGATYTTIGHTTTVGSAEGGNYPLNANLDEVRITKGVARYASDSGFSVPSPAFPRS